MRIAIKILFLILVICSCTPTRQYGKITVLKTNGQYTDSLGRFVWDGKDPFWYNIRQKKFNLEANELLIYKDLE